MTEPTALYRHFDKAGTLLYVGVSFDPLHRFKQHCGDNKCWVDDIASMTLERFDNRFEALQAEKRAIKNELPKYNIAHNAFPPLTNGPKRNRKPKPILGPKGMFNLPKRFQFLSRQILEVYRKYYDKADPPSLNYSEGQLISDAASGNVYRVVDILFERFVILKSGQGIDEPHFLVVPACEKFGEKMK